MESMNEQRQGDQGEMPFERAFNRKRQFAFLTTTLAFFVLLCFVGSVFLTEFETRTSLEVSSSGEITDSDFRKLIESELTDAQLQMHIDAVKQQSVTASEYDIVNQDYDLIRDAISFRKLQYGGKNQYRLSAVVSGWGSELEQKLTQSIAHGIAHQIERSERIASAVDNLNRQFVTIQSRIEANASVLDHEMTTAYQLANELNQGLSDVHRSVANLNQSTQSSFGNLASNSTSEAALERANVGQLILALQQKINQFNDSRLPEDLANAAAAIARIKTDLNQIGTSPGNSNKNSIRVINASLPKTNSIVNSILDSLAACDVDSIQQQLTHSQSQLGIQAKQLREDVTAIKLITDELTANRCIVNSVSSASTAPAESQPLTSYLLLFASLSACLGAVVSMRYRPEIENLGFESKADAEKILGIKVVANVEEPVSSDRNPEKDDRFTANNLVRVAEIGLFGFCASVILLCLLLPELRQAFFESPFYGLSKMSTMFFG